MGVAAALAPALAAHAAPTVTLSVAPHHGVPGAAITGTINVAECSPDSISVTGTYVDVDGEDATTPAVAATNQGNGVWSAALTVPADAARTSLSDEPVTFTATPDSACDPDSQAPESRRADSRRAAALPAAVVATGTATVVVDDLAAATLTVTPASVKAGGTFTYSISSCVGGIADFYLEDNDGNDTDIEESTVTSHPSATAYTGTMTVPADAVTGDAGVFLECAQSGPADAALLITDGSAGNGGGAPVAVPVDNAPTFTG
jgi:hypothetical protein